MTLKESATFLYEFTHPARSKAMEAMKKYFENMYYG